MIVRVHREEIRQLLERHFGQHVKDFVIISDHGCVIGNAFRAAVHDPLNLDFKITNIKAIRNISIVLGQPLTLLEGKWALLNWIKWITFVDEHGRMPRPGYGSGPGEGKLR